jgi:Rrf2 family protein
MNLTSKSRYALKIMMDLAHYGATQPLVRRGEIATRQGVPTDYLDQIMIKLRSGNLVESTRGRSGGYKLARHPDQITMWDLFSTVEESMIPVECISSGHECDFERSCSSKDAWNTIFGSLKNSLSTITLGSLAKNWAGEALMGAPTHPLAVDGASAEFNVQECRGGGRCEPNQETACQQTQQAACGVGLNG